MPHSLPLYLTQLKLTLSEYPSLSQKLINHSTLISKSEDPNNPLFFLVKATDKIDTSKCSGFFLFSFFLLGLNLGLALALWALLSTSRLYQVIFFSFDFDFDHFLFSVLFFFFFFISLGFISDSPFMVSASSQVLRSMTSLVSGNFYC